MSEQNPDGILINGIVMSMAFGKKLNDVSISRKLYFTIGFTVLLVIIELCTLWFSITTLSAVRSYVGGEGLWSKAQKDAMMHLREYAHTHNEQNYTAFKGFLSVPMGDKAARLELQKPEPNFELARKHLEQGRNHPDDIDGMMKLLIRFHGVHYLKKAFTAWANAEPALEELILIGEKLNQLIKAGAREEEIAGLLKDIEQINQRLTKLEDDFSFTLGEGARWLEGLVLKLVLALSLTIGTTTIILSVSINRNLQKGVNAIIIGAEKIRSGLVSTRVPVYSKDEIGMIAVAFNEMTATVEENIKAQHSFLISMSHEMRTPMNAILGFGRHLRETELNTERQESLKIVIEAGERLLSTLNTALKKIEKVHEEGTMLRELHLNCPSSISYELKGAGVKVLIVEDNQVNQLLAKKILERYCFETETAENGKIALDKLKRDHFDIVLMDLQMPEMDGYEASRRIREPGSGWSEVPIIAMTAHTVSGDRERCMAIGINEYISKPYKAAELYEKMQQLLGSKVQGAPEPGQSHS